MFWVLLALLIAVPVLLGAAGRQRALAAAHRKALPEAAVGLRARLAGLDAAIEGVRSVLNLMTAPMAMASAVLALRRLGTSANGEDGGQGPLAVLYAELADRPIPPDAPGEAGPATQSFEALLVELDRIDEADQRDLADVGLDRGRIVSALAAPVEPERWVRELVSALDYWQDAVANLRDGTAYR